MSNANDNISISADTRQILENHRTRTNEILPTRVHQDLSIYMLSNLQRPSHEFSLEDLFPPRDSGMNKQSTVVFETFEDSQAEDKRRADALQHLPRSIGTLEKLRLSDLDDLDDWLNVSASTIEDWGGDLTRASATDIRKVRLRSLGAILKFVSDHPELNTGWITASHPDWSFGIKDAFWDQWHFPAPRMFRSMLRIGGVVTAAGYLFAYLHVQFDPAEKRFFIQFRGICAGEKLEHFGRLRDGLAQPQNLALIKDYLGLRADPSHITKSRTWRGRYYI